MLPPLDIVEPASTATNEVANGPLEQPLDVPIPDEQPPSSLAEDLLIGPPAPQVRVSEPAPPASSDEIAPQMLLQFFSKDGTPQGVVQTPVEFTPPPPSRGSTATYISR